MERQITIGVMIGNANSPYSMDLMQGIYRAAGEMKVNLIFYLGIHNTYAFKSYFGDNAIEDYDYQVNIVYDYTELSKVDAIIVAYGSLGIFIEHNDVHEFMKRFGNIPYVILGDRDESGTGTSIIADNYHGMYEVVEHLIRDHHYRKITYLAGPKGNRDAIERGQAVRDALEKYKIPFDETYIERGDFSQCVDEQIEALFEKHPDMDAMVCANDLMADTAYRICAEKGLKVGKDIAVTGFDNWLNSTYMDPPLTTVLQNAVDLGYMTMVGAMELVNGRQPHTVIVPAQVQYRQSCGCEKCSRFDVPKTSKDYDTVGMESRALRKRDLDAFDVFRQESWFIPHISREMMSHIDDEKVFYQKALEKLAAFRIRKSWLFIFPEPVLHKRYSGWKLPDYMHLMAHQSDKQVYSYSREDAPVLSCEHTLNSFHSGTDPFALSIFCLYSGEKQYGIFVTEIEPSNLNISYLISMQIANALKFHEVSEREREVNKSLEKLVQEVREKNEVLNFISEYDPMTGCLNRRGFIERAVRMTQTMAGEEVAIIFADVDHLKEINDTFGHIEGDYAISQVTSVLQQSVGNRGIIGRVGGDEFVVMTPADESFSGIELINQIRAAYIELNASSDKSYYIESSMGMKQVYCDENLSLTDVLKEADQYLYAAKKRRRVSVCKDIHDNSTSGNVSNIENEYHTLTGLYYNKAFFMHVDERLRSIPAEEYCLVAIDIEHFRMFNKWYGRGEGDKLLEFIASKLRWLQKQFGGVAGYLGGDNFGILMPYQIELLQKMQKNIQAHLRTLAQASGFLPAFGVYPIKYGLIASINMYDNAMVAQAAAIGDISNRIKVYQPSMVEDVEKELLLISEVKEALENHEFTFYAQPQCDISTGKIIGAESLIRWEHKSRGLIPPAEFIPILERKGFIADLDTYIWEEVCRWLRSWIDRGKTPVPISVNVSRVDIFVLDVPDYLEKLLQKYQLPSRLLKIEITESAYAENDKEIYDTVKRLRAKGFVVMMDDFGSGYSSMNMLKNVPVDVLKIDMRFIDLNESTKDKGLGILETIVNLSRQIDIPVIIEGVESKYQEDFLNGMGCRYTQGFYYYRPMPVSQLEQLLSDSKKIELDEMWGKQSEVLQIAGILSKDSLNDIAMNSVIGPAALYEQNENEIRILRINEQYAKLSGALSAETAGYERKYIEHIMPEQRIKLWKLFEDAYQNQLNGSQGIIQFVRADGEVRPVHLKLMFLQNNNEKRQYFGVLTDISDCDNLFQEESYEFSWIGKKEALEEKEILPQSKLFALPEISEKWDDTENLYIEGENMETLKLLTKQYAEAVKMIYIDPPYNTGHDFVYRDQSDRSAWCSMMFARLALAKELLRKDGLIYISIDDNELDDLLKICNEIFGTENFRACFPRVTKKAGKSTDAIAKNHDYVLAYSKTSSYKMYLPEHTDPGFRYEDEFVETRGKYKLNQTLDYNSLQYSASLDYPITIEGETLYPGRSYEDYLERQKGNHARADWAWRWSRELFEFGYQNGFVVLKKYADYSRIYTKTYQNAKIKRTKEGFEIVYSKRTKPISSLEFTDKSYSNDNSKKNLMQLFSDNVFDYSKPVSLLQKLVRWSTADGDIVMDFFSGSATTAQAVIQENAEHPDMQRKYIMVQLEEPCDERSEAYKAGYRNICEIGLDRIRKSIDKVKRELPDARFDDGFRVYRLMEEE